jgi:hypothetical protein
MDLKNIILKSIILPLHNLHHRHRHHHRRLYQAPIRLLRLLYLNRQV